MPIMGAFPSTALVDESFRRNHVGEGFFLLSAVVVSDRHHAMLQKQLRALVAPGQRRWHFRDESPASRRKFLSTVAELRTFGLTAVTFCCATASPRKSEQARVRCLWNLLEHLSGRGVQTVVLESRQEHNDRKDRREILSAQRAGVAAPA